MTSRVCTGSKVTGGAKEGTGYSLATHGAALMPTINYGTAIMTNPKIHPNTPGMYLEYKYKVGEMVGSPLRKSEVEYTMSCYINDVSPESCAADIQRKRREALL